MPIPLLGKLVSATGAPVLDTELVEGNPTFEVATISDQNVNLATSSMDALRGRFIRLTHSAADISLTLNAPTPTTWTALLETESRRASISASGITLDFEIPRRAAIYPGEIVLLTRDSGTLFARWIHGRPSQEFNVTQAYITNIGSSITIDETFLDTYIDCEIGPFTINLPDPSNRLPIGFKFFVVNRGTANDITIAAPAGQNLTGRTTVNQDQMSQVTKIEEAGQSNQGGENTTDLWIAGTLVNFN